MRRNDYCYGANMQMCHSLRCKLLDGNMESLGKSFPNTSKVESDHFGSCVSLLRICSILPWAFAHTSGSQEVRSCLLVFSVRVARGDSRDQL